MTRSVVHNHEELADILSLADELGQEWILCYNDTEKIRNLYKDFYIEDATWLHTIRNKKDSTSGGEIIVISNNLLKHLYKCPFI